MTDHLAIATKTFGPQCVELSRPPHDVRFGDGGLISIDTTTGRCRATAEIRVDGLTFLEMQGSLKELAEIKKKNGSSDALTVLEEFGRQIIAEAEAQQAADEECEAAFAADRRDPVVDTPRDPRTDDERARAGKIETAPKQLAESEPEKFDAPAAGLTICICRDKTEADRVCELGFAATSIPGGEWKSAYAAPLQDADIVLLLNGDLRKTVADSLAPIARRRRVLEPPNLADCSADEFARLVAAAPDYAPTP